MRAEIIKGQSTSSARLVLADNIPLDTPCVIQIFPAYACNFRCKYCIHSLSSSKRGFVSEKTFMDYAVYEKCIDDILGFPRKVKMLRFAATGEPLLHPRIGEMIEYASKKGVTDSIEIVTNASLLTHELTDKLINSGLNWLRVSVQGLTSKKYKEITGVNFQFEKLVDNLKYFYKNKKETKVYIKIIDVALNKDEEKLFYHIFGDICEKIAIEYLVPAVPDIDYAGVSNSKFILTQNGNEVNSSLIICPQSFFMMQINPDGNVVPCCSMQTAYVAGNCKNENLIDIWNGEKYKAFQIMQLKKEKATNRVCRKCQLYKYAIFKEDVLDDNADELLKLYLKMRV